MQRLIDAEKVYEVLTDYYHHRTEIQHEALKEAISKVPTVDAVEVVRCKDCKWYKESNHSELYPMRFCYRLKNDDGVPVGYNWADNDFCSYGERREER